MSASNGEKSIVCFNMKAYHNDTTMPHYKDGTKQLLYSRPFSRELLMWIPTQLEAFRVFQTFGNPLCIISIFLRVSFEKI